MSNNSREFKQMSRIVMMFFLGPVGRNVLTRIVNYPLGDGIADTWSYKDNVTSDSLLYKEENVDAIVDDTLSRYTTYTADTSINPIVIRLGVVLMCINVQGRSGDASFDASYLVYPVMDLNGDNIIIDGDNPPIPTGNAFITLYENTVNTTVTPQIVDNNNFVIEVSSPGTWRVTVSTA